MKDYYIANRECFLERSKEYQKTYKQANKTRIIERDRAYYQSNRDKIVEREKAYYKINIDKLAKYSKIYYQANKAKIAERKKLYHQTPKGKATIKNSYHCRRTLTRQGDATSKQLLELEQNAKICYWCNKSLKNKKVHIDHYIPLSKGGEHTLSNLVASCPKCNSTKHAKDPIVFANSIGKLL